MFIKHILVKDILLSSGITQVTENAVVSRCHNLIRKQVLNSYPKAVTACHDKHMIKNTGKREKGVIYSFSVSLGGSCQL